MVERPCLVFSELLDENCIAIGLINFWGLCEPYFPCIGILLAGIDLSATSLQCKRVQDSRPPLLDARSRQEQHHANGRCLCRTAGNPQMKAKIVRRGYRALPKVFEQGADFISNKERPISCADLRLPNIQAPSWRGAVEEAPILREPAHTGCHASPGRVQPIRNLDLV